MGGLMDSRQAEPHRSTGRYQTMAVGVGSESGPVSTTSTPSRSHLDSFFEGSGWTRDDVAVIAAGIQVVLWLVLLYVEVQRL